MQRTFMLILLFLTVSAATWSLYAHDEDLRSGKIPRWTAYVSEEVAREKLKTLGVLEVGPLREEKGHFIAQGRYQGRLIEVEVDRQSGILRERGQYEPLAPAERTAVPMIRDFTLKIERSDIARAKIIVEPLAPDRPEAIR